MSEQTPDGLIESRISRLEYRLSELESINSKSFSETQEDLRELAKLRNPNKKIDMSCCIDGIDCEFSEDGFEQPVENQYYDKTVYCIDKLFNIGGRKSEHRHISMIHGTNNWFEYCRPRMNHVHACPKGFDKCPLPEGFIVDVYYNGADFEPERGPAESFVWGHNGNNSDIIAFEVLGMVDGYTL